MKRVFSVLAVILLVAACAVPVMAAESYDFYWNEVQFLPDFGYVEESPEFFIYEGTLSSGKYSVFLLSHDFPSEFVDFGLIDVSLSFDEHEGCYMFEAYGSSKLVSDGVLQYDMPYSMVGIVDDSLSGIALFFSDEMFVTLPSYYLSFIPLADQSQIVLDSMGTLSALMSSGVQLISGNWYTVLLLALSLLGLGAVAIRKLKRP